MKNAVSLIALLAVICCNDTTAPLKVGPLASISAGTIQTCGLTPVAAAYCWGGLVGDGTEQERLIPTPVNTPAGLTFISLSAGGGHTCGLNAAGAAYCWGENLDGQVGDGTTTNRLTPVAVALPPGMSLASISTGTYHSCGLTAAGAAHCWGSNEYGQLGDGTTAGRLTPAPVTMPAGTSFTSIAVGWIHSCALTAAGAAYCWGNNGDGLLGDSTTTDRLIPTAVAMPVGVTFMTLAAGIIHMCGLTPAGTVYCWGSNTFGRVGDGTNTHRLTPTLIAMPPGVTMTSVRAGYSHTCALTPTETVYCWGRNVFGELGDGTTTNRWSATPVVMPVGVTFASLDVGYVHSCGLTATGEAYCWGVNLGGRLGDGTATNRLTPVKVVQD